MCFLGGFLGARIRLSVVVSIRVKGQDMWDTFRVNSFWQ